MELGVSKLEIVLMLPGIRKRLRRAISKTGRVDVGEFSRTMGYVTRRIKKAAKKPYRKYLESQAVSLDALGNLLGGKDMKIELGITVGEITAMLPTILSEAWGAYSDDKKITVDEGIGLVAVILNEMAGAADGEEVKAFFASQSAALESLAALFEDAGEEEPPVDPPADPE